MDRDASFGHWLALRRKALRLSRVELAQRVGCAAVTLRKIEADERRPSRQIAERLLEHLALAPRDRATFISAARGELCVDRLPPPDLPPLLTHYGCFTNLPVPSTPLVGRADNAATIRAYLIYRKVRLLTLTGAPGIGKTRLAIQVATELRGEFADGVFFVNLAPLRDPALVAGTLAAAIGLKETAGVPLAASLQEYLRDKQTLLLIDNFEQVIEAAPVLAEVLATCANVQILATSRATLHLSGEHEFVVPPLALPDLRQSTGLAVVATSPAVALFVARAQMAQRAFMLTDANAATVASICRRLDGLPLAIELAAARVKLLPLPALLTRLENRLPVLTGGARDLPARQQTIHAAIDWSYRLLGAGEQALFARLGVFVDGCTLEAVEAVCNIAGDLPIDILEGLAALVDKSLLRQTEGHNGEPRFSMLETIGAYAWEQLAKGEHMRAVQQQHMRYFFDLVEQAASQSNGPDQRAWFDRLHQERGNLRAALDWIVEQDAADLGIRLVRALEAYWFLEGYHSEGHQWTRTLLTRARSTWPDDLRAQALQIAGAMAWQQGDYAAARGPLEESAAIYRRLNDKRSLAGTLNPLGRALLFQGEHEQACILLEENISLSREIGDIDKLARALQGRAYVAIYQADYRAARLFLEQCLSIGQTTEDQWGIAQSLNDLGDVARCEGDYPQAAALYQESLTRFQAQEIRIEIAAVLHNLGYVALAQGDQHQARASFAESLALHRERMNRPGILEGLAGFGAIMATQGQPRQAAVLFGAIIALRAAFKLPMWPAELLEYERHVARVRTALGDEALRALLAEGSGMRLEDSIEYALASLPTSV
jgi:predicted ATPase